MVESVRRFSSGGSNSGRIAIPRFIGKIFQHHIFMMVADSLNFNKVQYLEQSSYFLYQSSGQGFNFASSGK